MFSTNDRVVISDRFPDTKLAILNLKVGDKGTVWQVMRSKPGVLGIAIVKWDGGRRTNANEYDLDPA